MNKQADYKCLNCQHEWSERPGPTQCPSCGHLYIEWTNYYTDFERR